MILIAEIALWLAFAGAAWNTGVYVGGHLARGRVTDAAASPLTGRVAIGIGALLVLTWGVLAGALLRGDLALALTIEGVPIAASGSAAVSALWGTARGGLFSLALIVALAALAMSPGGERSDEPHASRSTGVLSGLLLALLALSVLLLPPLAPAAAARAADGPPLYLVDGWASAASLCAIGAIAAALVLAALLVAGDRPARSTLRATTVIGWLLATLLIGAEQVVRNRLGLTAQDPVVLGSSRAGLLLWLVLSVLLHERVRRFLLPRHGETSRASGRWPMHAAHAGAALVVAAFALHIVAARSVLSLPPGTAVEARDVFGRPWELVNQGVSQFDTEGRDIMAVAIAVTAPGGSSRVVSSERRQYFARTGAPLGAPLGVRGTWSTPSLDFRLVTDSVLAGDSVRVRVSFVPLALLWHLGIALMVIGGVGLFAARPHDANLERPSLHAEWEGSTERITTS